MVEFTFASNIIHKKWANILEKRPNMLYNLLII